MNGSSLSTMVAPAYATPRIAGVAFFAASPSGATAWLAVAIRSIHRAGSSDSTSGLVARSSGGDARESLEGHCERGGATE